MHFIRSGRRRLAIVASGVFALSLSAGTALAAPCLDCEDPELPGDPGGNPTCGITTTVDPVITTATPRVGETATGTKGNWAGSPTGYAYQWLAGGVAIVGATGLTSPELPATAQGKPLVLRVIATKSGCQSGVNHSAAKNVELGAAPVLTTNPMFSTASPKVGTPISVSSGIWGPAATSYHYQWRVGGGNVAGATSQSFTPPASALGYGLSVVVTAHRTGHTSGSSTRTVTTPVAQGDAPVATESPKLSAWPQVGVQVSLSTGSWTPAATSFSHQWQADGVDIAGATTASYVPTADLAGKALRVVVTAKRVGHLNGSAVSDVRTIAAAPVTPLAVASQATVSGKPVFGRTVTVLGGTFTGDPTTVSAQWYRNGVAITGATSRSHKVGLADLGRRLTVVITASRAGTGPVATTANAGTALTAPSRWTGPRVKLTGKAKVGRVIKPSLSALKLRRYMAPDATRVSYQWFRSGKAIAKAKSASHRVVRSDRGKRLMVRVVLTRPGYKAIVLRSTTMLIRR